MMCRMRVAASRVGYPRGLSSKKGARNYVHHLQNNEPNRPRNVDLTPLLSDSDSALAGASAPQGNIMIYRLLAGTALAVIAIRARA